MIASRKEIRAHVLLVTRQDQTQIGDLVNEFINRTISEINDPAWASPRGNYNHLWNFLKRKKTFATVGSTADYVMGREVDKIAVLRQTASPIELSQVRDEDFFKYNPNPNATGNPIIYRIWETEGVSVRLDADDTINVKSSSSSDAGSDELAVSVMGYDTNGIWRTETFTLNGTALQSGTITFDSGREVYVTKQKNTTGSITVTENSGGTTLVVLGPEERAPRFKILTLYPTPSSAITMYLEFYTFLHPLNNDSDVPGLHEKWLWVVVLGTLAKVYQYLNKDETYALVFNQYKSAVWSMVSSDAVEPDLVDVLDSRLPTNNWYPPRRADETQI